MTNLNTTHDPGLRSWVDSANVAGSDFPIQNLPYGVFAHPSGADHIGVAIGDQILDLTVLEARGTLRPGGERAVFDSGVLNPFLDLGQPVWSDTRRALCDLLAAGNDTLRADAPLMDQGAVQMRLPVRVSEFTDFYASYEHAMNVGRIFRGDKAALVPNWLHMPIAYNGRASTVVVSGTPITRPCGQIRPAPDAPPVFAPSAKLDFEVELGAIVGTGSAMGTRLSTAQAQASIFGFVLLNDWSARDIQLWEYQPLGPFQSKAFGTTISPWIVTAEALEPFRMDPPERRTPLLPYLHEDSPNAYDILIDVWLATQGGAGRVISRTNSRHLYYTAAAQMAHHTACGCAMRSGDLLGSGTISGLTPDSLGCMLELTQDGRAPLAVDGALREFLEDGDTLGFQGRCTGDYTLGFGTCAGQIRPAT
ncbi:MAG: fumarylacetoacetase [Marinibacterium sp.]|nr:fumarylacetoacetase [Marinibacterium sp.]